MNEQPVCEVIEDTPLYIQKYDASFEMKEKVREKNTNVRRKINFHPIFGEFDEIIETQYKIWFPYCFDSPVKAKYSTLFNLFVCDSC